MTLPARTALLLLLVAVLAGCRQPDGPMPEATGDFPDRIEEMGRGIAVSSLPDEPAIEEWLAVDLAVLAGEEPGEEGSEALQALAVAVGDALQDAEMTEEAVVRLANDLWLVVAGRELSAAQHATVREGLGASLTAAGAPEATVGPVLDRAEAVQASLSLRPRRWYEIF